MLDYIEQLRINNSEDAFFALLEMDYSMLPELMAAFWQECDGTVRELLVEVIWQHRQSSVIPFLAEALKDPLPEVWKQAIDGLVALASPQSLKVLLARTADSTPEQRDWLNEAIEQVRESL